MPRRTSRPVEGAVWDLSSKFSPSLIGNALTTLWTVDGSFLSPAVDIYNRLPQCPITKECMTDPVLLSDGCVYERASISEWIQSHENAPFTNVIFDHKTMLRLAPLEQAVQYFLNTVRFVGSAGQTQLRVAVTSAEEELGEKSTALRPGLEALRTLQRRLAQGLVELKEFQSLLDRGCEAVQELERRSVAIATKRIQKAVRIFRSRRRLDSLRTELSKAVSRVAATARTFAARRRLLIARSAELRRRRAACQIQAQWRSWHKHQAMLMQLCLASRNGNLHVAKLFIERDAPLNGVTVLNGVSGTPLVLAAGNGHVEVAHALLQARADINRAARNSATPMFFAAQNRHTEVVRLLCEAKACIDKVSYSSATPLYMAAQEGCVEIVRLLCTVSADCNLSTTSDVSPLYMAAQDGHAMVVACLCEARADQDAIARNGTTPLFMASQNGHAEVVRVLCEAGANRNKESCEAVTPLFMAAQNGHVEVVQRLCACKRDSHADDLPLIDLQKSLLIAHQQGYEKVVDTLSSILTVRMPLPIGTCCEAG